MANLPDPLIDLLRQHVGHEHVYTDKGECWPYGFDNSKQSYPPDAVVFPKTHDEVVAIVQVANENRIPIVPRGRGSGTVGGAVPTHGGIILSFERMAQILRLDPDNRLMTVQPGVTNQAVQEAAATQGFFWAPDPSSAAFCSIGGNLAHNSAGPRAVKYGSTRENTLALRAVTGDGKSLRTGTQTSKGVVGYDLTRLIIGSEGTLAICTEATLKLIPKPWHKITMQAIYSSLNAATTAVAAIMAQAITPCTLEFMDRPSLLAIQNTHPCHLPKEMAAMLMIEVDGSHAALDEDAAAITAVAQNDGLLQWITATQESEVKALWAMRKALSPALRKIAPKKINEDVVVPVAQMPALIEGVHQICQEYGIKNANFGHAGNGNIHVNLLANDQDAAEMRRAEQCLAEVFKLVIDLQGSLSGEHGIGLMKQPFIDQELDQTHLDLMRGIKQQFDPKGILNPGKIWQGQRI